MWQAVVVVLLGVTCAVFGIVTRDIPDILIGAAVFFLGVFVVDPVKPKSGDE